MKWGGKKKVNFVWGYKQIILLPLENERFEKNAGSFILLFR